MRYAFAALVAVAALLLSGRPSAGQSPPAAAPESTATRDTTVRAAIGVQVNVLYYLHGDSIVAAVRFSPIEPRLSAGAGDIAANLLWSGGGKSWMTVEGETSELPIAEPQPRFGIVTDRVTALSFRLGAFQVRKGKRWAQTEEGRPREIFRKGIPLEVREAALNRWILSPKEPLKPGEYCLATFLNGPVGDFTVVGAAHQR